TPTNRKRTLRPPAAMVAGAAAKREKGAFFASLKIIGLLIELPLELAVAVALVATGDDLVEVVIPKLSWVGAQGRGRLSEQRIPGAFDVLGRERCAIVPLHSLAQLKRQRSEEHT